MTTVRDMMHFHEARNDDSDIAFVKAVENYDIDLWDREVSVERFPLDALVFAEHQQPWIDFETYKTGRLHYDPETNYYLEVYVRHMARNVDQLPPVLLHLTDTGVALVDGCHRTSSLLMFTDEIRINAWVVA